MTDKDRIEEMEELLSNYYENIDDTFAATDNAMAIIDKVGYFVKRVQELERSNKQIKRNISVYQSINEDAVEKNKRYRDSIKKAISYFNYDEHQRGMAELQEVLEEY